MTPFKDAPAPAGYGQALEEDEDAAGADLVVVCPGKPRIPGVKMDRRELVGARAREKMARAHAPVSDFQARSYSTVTRPAMSLNTN